jgi:hypothetical protein
MSLFQLEGVGQLLDRLSNYMVGAGAAGATLVAFFLVDFLAAFFEAPFFFGDFLAAFLPAAFFLVDFFGAAFLAAFFFFAIISGSFHFSARFTPLVYPPGAQTFGERQLKVELF